MKGRIMTDAETKYGEKLDEAIKVLREALSASVQAGYDLSSSVYTDSDTTMIARTLESIGQMHHRLYEYNPEEDK